MTAVKWEHKQKKIWAVLYKKQDDVYTKNVTLLAKAQSEESWIGAMLSYPNMFESLRSTWFYHMIIFI